MPTVARFQGYRFFFYSNDHVPIHVHVEKGDATAKYGIEPIRLIENHGFGPQDLRRIRILIERHEKRIRTRWNEHFGDRGPG